MAIVFPQEPKFLWLTLKEKKIRVEVARTEGEKAKGLMFREKLGKNEGMLFVFERKKPLLLDEKYSSLSPSLSSLKTGISWISRTWSLSTCSPTYPPGQPSTPWR
jgi:hypothetical protein